MTITVHTLVKNEIRFVWFAVMSVIDYVDEILLWDTGSTDGTWEIIKELEKKGRGKVKIKECGEVDALTFTKVRQEMLEKTKSDWFMIVDGDEVWWEESIKKVTETIRTQGKKLDSIVTPFYNIVGDIYHYQEEKAGMYHIDDRSGHINIRAINRSISGIHFDKPHGSQGIYDEDGKLIQDRPKSARLFVSAPYMHFSNVIRSSARNSDLKVPKRKLKLKYDLGRPFPAEFKYPEVFNREFPPIIPLPWVKRPVSFTIRSFIETPLRKIKRRLVKRKVGY